MAFKEAALIVGRRGGKSRALALIAVFLATFRNYTAHLAAGEVATIAIIAADRRQARSIFRFITGLLQGIEMLSPLIEEETAERITLTNRVAIEIHTASFRVTRGYSFAAVLCDEIAFWRDESGAVPDVEIIRALRPGLASIPGSILLLASSPYARRGVLWNAYKVHFGRDEARVLVWRGTTAEMNPLIDPAIIAAAYEEDPESAAAEFGAEFRSDVAAFVAREVVEACTMNGRHELPRLPGVTYSAFTDPSGGSADSFTLAVAHRSGDVAVLDCVREVRPPFSPESVTSDFAVVLKSYGINKVVGDRFGGEWVREQFRAYGISYDLAEQPKSDIYRDTLPLLNSGKVELLDIPRLAAQLIGLERRTARSGRDSIDHGPGGHDDVANSVCGALLLAKMPPAQGFRTVQINWMGR